METKLINEILEAGKRLYAKGFVASNDGNISARVSETEFLITATGICKGDMNNEHIIKVDIEGNVISGVYKPSSELKMHLAVYKSRTDVMSIVHAHPQKATAFAVAGLSLDRISLPEAVFSLGKVSLAEYGTPSTSEVPNAVAKCISCSDVVLMKNHGALTAGKSVMDAYFKMETLEHFASISLYARLLGGEQFLSDGEVERLFQIRTSVFGK